ncbi:AraC-like DNA-binding protein [Neisseria sp. HSC-16F19]|nr:helix-turn-helix domain-containing protein [Neisseria sp. HSC-16F19]MCP2040002.1 AraC-like DNA-binding protein [Neisseria sp. HSC-16F19]
MSASFSTRQAATVSGKHDLWRQAVNDTFFPLDLRFALHDRFEGCLNNWQLGDITLTYMQSAPAEYHRLPQHLHSLQHNDDAFLLTLPLDESVAFTQMQRQVECRAGNFLLELSHEPYRFSYERTNRLWAIKIPHAVLNRHVHLPERYVAHLWDGQSGVGWLLQQYLHLCGQQLLLNSDADSRQLMGRQILELFTHMVRQGEQKLISPGSDTRRCHLQRIEQYILRHLEDTQLNPQKVADACHISVRYLHNLFGDTGTSFGQWLKQQRLQAAQDLLSQAQFQQTLASVAYQVGFTDQAHFSRAFKQAYGLSPKDWLQQQRLNESGI